MNSRIIELLSRHRIKPTPMRMLVLEQMLLHGRGVSLNDLEALLVDSDRVTIYRTLRTFAAHGLVHSIESVNRGAVYALCRDECSPQGHDDYHIHFHCESCHRVDCLDTFPRDLAVKAAEGREVTGVAVIITGLCAECLGKKR